MVRLLSQFLPLLTGGSPSQPTPPSTEPMSIVSLKIGFFSPEPKPMLGRKPAFRSPRSYVTNANLGGLGARKAEEATGVFLTSSWGARGRLIHIYAPRGGRRSWIQRYLGLCIIEISKLLFNNVAQKSLYKRLVVLFYPLTEMRKSDGSAVQTVTCSEKAVININITTSVVSALYQWIS